MVNNPFEKLPDELIPYLGFYLNLKDYVNFAMVAKRYLHFLTNNNSIKFYDPILATVLAVNAYFIEIVFSRKILSNYTQLAVIKKIISLYEEVKDKVLATEIELDENMLIKMLDCYLSGMDEQAKRELKFKFLNKLFADYFKLKTHFIFDSDLSKLPIFTDHTKLGYLITCIDALGSRSFKKQKYQDNVDKIAQSPVTYFFATRLLSVIFTTESTDPDIRIKGLIRTEELCYQSYQAGAKSSVFLQLFICSHPALEKFRSKISSDEINQLEAEAFKILDIKEISEIKKANDTKHLVEILGRKNLSYLFLGKTAKAIKVLKKLLRNNSIASLQALDRKMWALLLTGEHSLEFINSLDSNIEILQECSPHLLTSVFERVCNSPNAFVIGELLREEILLPVSALPENWRGTQSEECAGERHPFMQMCNLPPEDILAILGTDPISQMCDLPKADLLQIYKEFVVLKKDYPWLYFVDFLITKDSADLMQYFQLQPRTCRLLYEKLGLQSLKLWSGIQIIVNNSSSNLLQALINLNVEQLDKILNDFKGDINYLKQSVTQPMEVSINALHSSDSSFFSQSQITPQKRSNEQELTGDTPSKAPKFSKSEAEED